MAPSSDSTPSSAADEPPLLLQPQERYDAFLAYHHDTDSKLSEQLKSGLEHLVRPARLARPALQVFRFRDMMNVPDADELWPILRDAIDRSRWFILLASTPSARSDWVGREIEQRVAVRGADEMVVVHTGGPVWHPARTDLDFERSPAIHPALRRSSTQPPPMLDMTWAAANGASISHDARYFDLLADLGALLWGLPREEVVANQPQRGPLS